MNQAAGPLTQPSKVDFFREQKNGKAANHGKDQGSGPFLTSQPVAAEQHPFPLFPPLAEAEGLRLKLLLVGDRLLYQLGKS